MIVTEQKRPLLPALVLGALVLVGCAVFGGGKYLERVQLEQLNELLANLPEEYAFRAEEIDGSLFGRTLTLRGVAFLLPSGDETVSVSIGAVSGEGLNLAAAFLPGTATLADRLTLVDVAVDDEEASVAAGRVTLSGVRADAYAIRNFLSEIKNIRPRANIRTRPRCGNGPAWTRSPSRRSTAKLCGLTLKLTMMRFPPSPSVPSGLRNTRSSRAARRPPGTLPPLSATGRFYPSVKRA